VNAQFDASPGDVLVLAAGHHDNMQDMLGKLRLYCADVVEAEGNVQLRDPAQFNFLWVDSFPLYVASCFATCLICSTVVALRSIVSFNAGMYIEIDLSGIRLLNHGR
jgi:hypothetical protein